MVDVISSLSAVTRVHSRRAAIAKMIAQRLSVSLLLMLAVSMLIFAGTELLPGDVATAILGPDATPEAVEAIRRSLHLSEPVATRYWVWLSGFLQGDIGRSLVNGRPIIDDVSFRLTNSFFLAGVAAVISIPVALVLGALSAIYQDKAFDRIISMISLGAISLPSFFIGYLLILFFSIKLQWLPSLAVVSPGMPFGERLLSMVLPAAVLVIGAIANTLRLTRATIIGVMSNAYIEMAFLKGLPRWRVVFQHALPNVLAPIASVIALTLAWLFVGVVVVEVVFVYPGIGQLMVDAVSARDVPVVQACGLVFAAVYISLNLMADIAALLANPRLRAG